MAPDSLSFLNQLLAIMEPSSWILRVFVNPAEIKASELSSIMHILTVPLNGEVMKTQTDLSGDSFLKELTYLYLLREI